MALLNPFSNAFGLDLGDRAFRLVQFKKNRHHSPPYTLTAWGEIPVPEGLMDHGEIKDMDKVVSLVSQLVRQAEGSLSGRAVVACLPETKTFIKILETTSEKTTQSLHNAVLKEIEQDIPLPPNDLYYDWQLLDEKNPTTPDQKIAEDTAAPSPISTDESAPEPSPTTKQVAATQQSAHILMGAAPKNLVDSYTLMLERAGLAPIGLDIEATSIARAVIGDAEK
jgi:Tfp pilus assembly PilM family ATPase